MRMMDRWVVRAAGLAVAGFGLAAVMHAAPVTVSGVRAEWKTKSTDPGRGRLYMKLYLTATVTGPVDRSESLYARVEGNVGGTLVSDDHSGGLLHVLSPGQSKSYDFPIFISNPLSARPESCNIIFSWGTVRSKSIPFAYFCLSGDTAVTGPCGAPAPASPARTSNAPVGVGTPRFEWKTASTGANRGGTYFKLYFDATVNAPVSQGEKIYVTCECKDGGAIKSDTFSLGSSKLYEVPVGRSSTLEYLFFFSSPLNGRPSDCNMIFRYGKLEKSAVAFASFCYGSSEVKSGSCW